MLLTVVALLEHTPRVQLNVYSVSGINLPLNESQQLVGHALSVDAVVLELTALLGARLLQGFV